MEEGGCGGNRRLTLLDHMTNSPVVGTEKRPTAALGPTRALVNKTLLDIMREEGRNGGSLFGHKDKKSWKVFRDRLRLKRAGAAWTSSVHIPASDIPVDNRFGNSLSNSNSRSFMSRHNSVRFNQVSSVPQAAESEGGNDDGAAISASRPQISRRMSTRFETPDESSADIHAVNDGPPEQSFMPQLSRHGSVRFSSDAGSEGISLGAAVAEERTMSAREAVSAQEAAEAGRDAEDEEDDEEGDAAEPVIRMSLMDLLEETDRQMGVVGSSYKVDEYDDAVEEDDDAVEGSSYLAGGGLERTCCVCMVRHKGAAFIPCGHTFCRMCSRELLVQRGNCPLCNGYILEILDIF